jgi:hypothetical protein
MVPLSLWLVLGIGASLTIAYMCAQADRREGPLVQAIPIAFFTAMVTAGFLVVSFLDHPYANHSGGIAPTEMRQTLTRIGTENATRRATSAAFPVPPEGVGGNPKYAFIREAARHADGGASSSASAQRC